MDEEEKKEKLKEYTERERFWTQQVLNQFGYTINLFTTMGIGFLGYLISIRAKYPKIIMDSSLPFDWNIALYFLTVASVFVSVLLGAISIISRLYDLRITRHLTWSRREVFKELTMYLPANFVDLKGESLVRSMKVFIAVLCRKMEFIGVVEKDNHDQLKVRFEDLRKEAKVLGDLSWRADKAQIIVLSLLIYSLTILE
ncbi:MAG: hypothetical protein ACLP05_13950 [Candidatus Kryptoniota bacterium]